MEEKEKPAADYYPGEKNQRDVIITRERSPQLTKNVNTKEIVTRDVTTLIKQMIKIII